MLTERQKALLKEQEYKQTGKRFSFKRDKVRKAKLPGWRVSKAGKLYFEARKNRSDTKGTTL